MEQDRYQQNSKLFIIGLISLLISLCLFAFAFYIAPHVFWQWRYNIPEFIWTWREWLRVNYTMTEAGSGWLMFLIFLIPAILFGYISYLCSNTIDNEIYGIEKPKPAEEMTAQKAADRSESIRFSVRVFLLIILVLLAVSLVEWLVTSPPPPLP